MGDTTSPYYLDSGDQPGNLIAHMIFKGVRTHAVATSLLPAAEGSSSFNTDNIGLANLSNEQVKAVLNLIKEDALTCDRKLGKYSCVKWIIDTGASQHVTGDVTCLVDPVTIPACSVGLSDGRTVSAVLTGRVPLSRELILDHVLYVPGLNCHLISVSQLADQSNCLVTFTNNFCAIQDLRSRNLIGAGERRDVLFYFRGVTTLHTVQTSAFSEFELWHRRMGHPSDRVLKLLPVIASSSSQKRLNKACEVCPQAKQVRDSFPASNNKASRILELIHCDLWGPYKTPSTCDAVYFLTLVDDFSRAVWVYLLRDKKEVHQYFLSFIAMVEKQFSLSVKIVRSDNGTEFKCMQPYFDTHGILFQTSCVHTPQQNGRVERKHRHILNVARALMFQASLPITLWGECVLTTVHLINRTPSGVLGGKTPYELLHGVPPNFSHLRVFGCLCFAHNAYSRGNKFSPRSRRGVFVGYPHGKKGWKIFDWHTGEIFVSRDVIFHEDDFPFSTPMHEPQVVLAPDSTTTPMVVDPDPVVVTPAAAEPPPTAPTNATTVPAQSETESLGRGLRSRRPSILLRDFVTHHVQKLSPSPSATSSVSSSAILAGHEPRSFKEAMTDVGWRQAMQSEIQALENNHTWVMEPLPPGKKALGCKWVYKIKYHSDGTVERLKARLVVFGNHQQEGIDYTETFAPVAKMVTVRMFLAVAVAKNWELHQLDVHNAFLHGDLDEEVYMKPPPGFLSSRPGQVCRLKKSLYGLRQAPRCWFAKLTASLKQYGFRQSYSDYSLFTMHQGSAQLYVLIYVDDLIIEGNDCGAISRFKSYLHKCFHMKDLGILKYFLGIEVARSTDGLFLCQRKYTLDIISEAGLLGAKPVAFPIEQNHGLALSQSALLADPESYRRLVGRLIYLSFTRPDLAYVVHILSQFMQAPRQDHWMAALRVVRYLKGSPGQGILFSSICDLTLTGWCDSDWASCPLTRRSLTGWIIFLGYSPISWKTKKQHIVSRSSTEAEYRSMADTTAELKWAKGLLLSLGIDHSSSMSLFCDSRSALHIAHNPVFHERTKHIEVDCHYVRDAIQNGLLVARHVSTTDQLAGIFTKALGKRQFLYLLGKLGIFEPHTPT
ncbi:unnamed protein product [Cuscuta epithymum]|uniref:Integrase catalytic domain-containing protein n=1 Tax=Cuscuta epithymum TaxID=186058 RepID=A0AAV0G3B3_9ASTE|nr:unnamed protein product [Cuscuta epithymum]